MFFPGGNVSDPYRSVCYDEAEALREVALASFVRNATVTSPGAKLLLARAEERVLRWQHPGHHGQSELS